LGWRTSDRHQLFAGGEDAVIAGTGRRFKCNLISALSNRGQLEFMIFQANVTVGVCLKFLRRLLQHHRRKVVLIWDGHPVHGSAAVAAFYLANVVGVCLFAIAEPRPIVSGAAECG
jgi:hypothetical protein